MNTITTSNLDDLKAPTTLDDLAPLLRAGKPLTLTECEERLCTAYHEAAHLVASVACPGSDIHRIEIRPFACRRFRRAPGEFDGGEWCEDEGAFVTLAGYAVTELMIHDRSIGAGRPTLRCAMPDYERGYTPRFEWVLDVARHFVRDHYGLIKQVGHGVLHLATKGGKLEGRKLDKLVDWIGPQVTPFRTRESVRRPSIVMRRYGRV